MPNLTFGDVDPSALSPEQKELLGKLADANVKRLETVGLQFEAKLEMAKAQAELIRAGVLSAGMHCW